MRRVFGLLFSSVGFLVIASSSDAGEMLHFKTGQVDARIQASFTTAFPAGQAFFVVQYQNVISKLELQNLTTLGAKVVRYVPDDALIVKASQRVAQTIQRSSTEVRAVLPFEGTWKVSEEFEPASVFTSSSRSRILIQLFPEETSDGVLRALEHLPLANVISNSDRVIIADVARAQIESIATLEGVEWIEPAPQIESFVMNGLSDETTETRSAGDYSDLSGYESGTRLIGIGSAYNRAFTGRGQIVSVADTGLDNGNQNALHMDFRQRVPTGFIFGLFAKSWNDPMGHGTHVAGSVMGSGQVSGGRLRGAAYEAHVVPEGMWSPMLNNLTVPVKLSELFAKAYDVGARIHTNSWGSPRNLGAYDALASQADEFMAANPEMLILFAAGNSGTDRNKDGRVDGGSVSSPSTAKNVLTVGASKNYVLKGGYQMMLSETKLKDNWPVEPLASSRLSESPRGIAAFSSRGPTSDGRIKPDVVAPGTNILSVRSQVQGASPLWGVYNSDYIWSGGTSMAAPIAAGAAAIVRQYLVENRKVEKPSAALMKAVMMHSAAELFPGQFGAIGAAKGQEILSLRPNFDEGYGRLDLEKATNLGEAILIDEKTGLATGETHTYPVRVADTARLTVTMVYTDAAASASVAKALVNDLDLVLVDPSGKEISLGDHINNAEMIQTTVMSGEYLVRITGKNVPNGPNTGKQPYAVIISL